MSVKSCANSVRDALRSWAEAVLHFFSYGGCGCLAIISLALPLIGDLLFDAHRNTNNIAVVVGIRADSTYDLGSVVATDQNGHTVIVLDIPVMYMPYMQVGDSLRYSASYPNPQFVAFQECITEFSIPPTGERIP